LTPGGASFNMTAADSEMGLKPMPGKLQQAQSCLMKSELKDAFLFPTLSELKNQRSRAV